MIYIQDTIDIPKVRKMVEMPRILVQSKDGKKQLIQNQLLGRFCVMVNGARKFDSALLGEAVECYNRW